MSIPVVMEQGIANGAANEYILIAIIVVVGDRHAKTVVKPVATQAGSLSDVFKRAIAFIAKQAVVERRSCFFELRQPSPVCEEDVQPTVIVEIEHSDASAECLD